MISFIEFTFMRFQFDLTDNPFLGINIFCICICVLKSIGITTHCTLTIIASFVHPFKNNYFRNICIPQ